MKFLRLFLSAVRPSVRPLKTSPDIVPVLSDIRRPTWCQYSGVNPIRCLPFRAKHFRAKCFRAKHPRSDVRQGQCQEKFFMFGRFVGWRGVGRRRALLDGGRRTDGSFYFFLEPPVFNIDMQ